MGYQIAFREKDRLGQYVDADNFEYDDQFVIFGKDKEVVAIFASEEVLSVKADRNAVTSISE